MKNFSIVLAVLAFLLPGVSAAAGPSFTIPSGGTTQTLSFTADSTARWGYYTPSGGYNTYYGPSDGMDSLSGSISWAGCNGTPGYPYADGATSGTINLGTETGFNDCVSKTISPAHGTYRFIDIASTCHFVTLGEFTGNYATDLAQIVSDGCAYSTYSYTYSPGPPPPGPSAGFPSDTAFTGLRLLTFGATTSSSSLLAAVSQSTQTTGGDMWPLIALAGIPITFAIGAMVVNFIRTSVKNSKRT